MLPRALLPFVFACRLLAFPAAEPEFSPERFTRIRTAMERSLSEGEMAGGVGLIARHGKIAYFEAYGMADREANRAMRKDSIFRLYSMTKAVTGVAVMTLYEQGYFSLHDPVARFLPEFKNATVATADGKTVPAEHDITILDLLRHTSGLDYAGPHDEQGKAIYKTLGIGGDSSYTLAELVRRIASAPLVHQPGTVWDYSYSIDVLARLVEVVSKQPIDEYFSQHIFRPLRMSDTGYFVPEDKWDRLTTLYIPHPGGTVERLQGLAQESYKHKPVLMGGGSGLVSTTSDYARFVQMLLNGGELEGTRILGRKTVDLMSSDQLGDLPKINNVNGRIGYGFGLTFAVNLGIEKTGNIGSKGEYNWGGAAGTAFWIDPREDMIGVFMTQVMPQRTLKDEFKQMVYQSLTGN